MSLYFILIALIILIAIIIRCIRIVPQAQAFVIERLGKYNETWEAGLHIKVPVIDRVARTVLLKEQVADFAPQPVITKDNVTMMIDSVVYFRVMNAEDYCYGVENPIMAMENLTATTLRNIIGDLTLDETLTSRETINSQMLKVIDEATDAWGIKVNRVELKNIQPPVAIREAMEKQMKAEREKRAAILAAEGEKQSAILKAQGVKESAVLEAEARKQATILEAEGVKEKEINEAIGQAEAIRRIKEAGADDSVIRLKSLEALAKVADGNATKIIVPTELASIAGLVSAVKESQK